MACNYSFTGFLATFHHTITLITLSPHHVACAERKQLLVATYGCFELQNLVEVLGKIGGVCVCVCVLAFPVPPKGFY